VLVIVRPASDVAHGGKREEARLGTAPHIGARAAARKRHVDRAVHLLRRIRFSRRSIVARKPANESYRGTALMTYDQLIGVLIDAPRDAWLHNDQKGVYTFKYDLDVTLRENRPDDDQLFQEPWATRFPDQNARRVTFELWYRASFVKEYYFV